VTPERDVDRLIAEHSTDIEREKTRLKQPSGRWNLNVDFLYKFTQAGNDAALPQVYKDLAAKSSTKDDRSILQRAVDNRARQFMLLQRPHIPFVITPSLVKDITNLHWWSMDKYQLEEGITIFQAFQGDSASRAVLLQAVATYDDVDRGNNATLEDARSLRAQMKCKLPTGFFEFRAGYVAWLNLIEVVLGEFHALPMGLAAAFALLESQQMFVNSLF
jgi:hypothetical protein